MPEQKQEGLAVDWVFFFYWLMATTSGWLLGWLVLPAIALVTAGIGAGVMQCLVLFRRIPQAWRWVLATAAGWLAGLWTALWVIPPGLGLLSGALIGATTGAAQWLLLRSHARWAGWWIVVSALAWSTAFSLAPASGQVVLPSIVLSGAMPAVLTGLTLELLPQTPKTEDRSHGS